MLTLKWLVITSLSVSCIDACIGGSMPLVGHELQYISESNNYYNAPLFISQNKNNPERQNSKITGQQFFESNSPFRKFEFQPIPPSAFSNMGSLPMPLYSQQFIVNDYMKYQTSQKSAECKFSQWLQPSREVYDRLQINNSFDDTLIHKKLVTTTEKYKTDKYIVPMISDTLQTTTENTYDMASKPTSPFIDSYTFSTESQTANKNNEGRTLFMDFKHRYLLRKKILKVVGSQRAVKQPEQQIHYNGLFAIYQGRKPIVASKAIYVNDLKEHKRKEKGLENSTLTSSAEISTQTFEKKGLHEKNNSTISRITSTTTNENNEIREDGTRSTIKTTTTHLTTLATTENELNSTTTILNLTPNVVAIAQEYGLEISGYGGYNYNVNPPSSTDHDRSFIAQRIEYRHR